MRVIIEKPIVIRRVEVNLCAMFSTLTSNTLHASPLLAETDHVANGEHRQTASCKEAVLRMYLCQI
jgi:hypothetical protein